MPDSSRVPQSRDSISYGTGITSDLFPRKGYLEQAFPRQDGLVPLRLCSTSERIYVEQKSLTKLEGRCSEPHPIWRISKFNPDGSVQITDTQTRKAQYVPPQIWAGAVSHLGGDMPAPKVGEFIAGADPNQAGAFYVLKSSPFR
jgi:hypothetical protein